MNLRSSALLHKICRQKHCASSYQTDVCTMRYGCSACPSRTYPCLSCCIKQVKGQVAIQCCKRLDCWHFCSSGVHRSLSHGRGCSGNGCGGSSSSGRSVVSVAAGVAVAVATGVSVGAAVATGGRVDVVGVGVDVAVIVGVGVAVTVGVEVVVSVATGVNVAVAAGVGVGASVAAGVGVGASVAAVVGLGDWSRDLDLRQPGLGKYSRRCNGSHGPESVLRVAGHRQALEICKKRVICRRDGCK